MKMDKETRVMVAKKLIRLADMMMESEVEEEIDPNFVAKVRALRQVLPRLAQKKRRKLRQFGIGLIRPNDNVESLIDALMAVANA